MTATRTLPEFIEQSRSWLFDLAFPLWSTAGLNEHGGFREDLSLGGDILTVATTRVRVQARQVFCFALAARLGWPGGAEVCHRGAHYLIRHGILSETGLPGTVIVHGQGLADDTVELYDVAFALLALSAAYSVTDDEVIGAAVLSLIAALDVSLRCPAAQGGYRESSRTCGPREQNPHMHLFEALLAAAAATGRNEVMEMAHGVARFVENTFVKGQGQLRELAGEGMSVSDNRIEAGHHFEWVWLLHQEGKLSGKPVSNYARQFFATGRSLSRPDGRVPLSHHLDGRPKSTVLRTWTITEAIKAYLVTGRKDGENLEGQLNSSLGLLFDDHLLDNGGWIDQREASGAQLSHFMPASTLYHIVFAMYELLEGRRTPVFGKF